MRVLYCSQLDTLHTTIILFKNPDAKYSPFGENSILLTKLEVLRLLILSPLDTLHIPIVLSQDPDAKYSPSGENTTLMT